jgi:hypothetical protein
MRAVDDARLRSAVGWGAWLGALLVLTAAMAMARDQLDKAHVALAYLLLVLAASARGTRTRGFAVALLAFLCFNYFFIPPFGTLAIHDARDWLVLFAFLVVAAVATHLLFRARSEAGETRRRELVRVQLQRWISWPSQQSLREESADEQGVSVCAQAAGACRPSPESARSQSRQPSVPCSPAGTVAAPALNAAAARPGSGKESSGFFTCRAAFHARAASCSVIASGPPKSGRRRPGPASTQRSSRRATSPTSTLCTWKPAGSGITSGTRAADLRSWPRKGWNCVARRMDQGTPPTETMPSAASLWW